VLKSEVAKLLTFVQSLQGREVTELQVEAWHSLLGDVQYQEAMSVAQTHYATETRPLWPADIRRATVDALAPEDSWMGLRR
jgi:hypothetical protein